MADHDNQDPADTPDPADDPADLDIADVEETDDGTAEEEQPQRLDLKVVIDKAAACERHISVTVPRADIQRYYDKEFTELMPMAQVPGFRPGRAPRKLIEARFQKDVSERVKSELLVACLSQISEEQGLSAISEPDIDLEAIEIPEEGDFTFEFDLEVRPEFDLPKWKGLLIERPVRDFTDADVDRALEGLLANRGRLVPCDGPAETGDYITTNLTFRHGDRVLSNAAEEVIRIRPVLSFRDGNIEQFDELMAGVRAGDSRTTVVLLTEDTPSDALRAREVSAEFEILEVKKLELPELDEELLDELGPFECEADLRDAIKDQLERQLEYERRRRARDQITAALTVAADWELPADLLEKQSHRELERAVLEMRRSGFSEERIRARQNLLHQNSRAATARALKEHFILERIAEDQEIETEQDDYDMEISLIAAQRGESARRVRARLEKSGSMDVLRNQIVERKVIELILAEAEFKEVAYEPEQIETEALDQAAGGQHSDIPQAVPDHAEASPRGRPAEPPMRD